MATISLREYVRKIENLIDTVQIDQAISHCKHILHIYPKHIDSYRLLGKALLEKQKYTDASDIFQRVLSSIPDDFISQIGMSIIREDENNMDAAIWHMERAFEVQPSNKAVQDELRRLYTKRDGIAPPKIRLTRGALVRMYTRGELYNQAVAEILAALSEDPNRVDLEVLLAKIYFLLGQKIDATETCSKLISKLPYCYEANKILSEILPGTSREGDVKIFKQRVVDLDPYYQFIDEKYLSAADVPESKIMIEYLEWDPSSSQIEEPDWIQSIGFSFDSFDGDKDDFSSWMKSSPLDQVEENETSEEVETEKEISFSFDESLGTEENKEPDFENDVSEISEDQKTLEAIDLSPDDTLPEWIKDAGWTSAEALDPELEKGFNLAENIIEDNGEGVISKNKEEEEEAIERAEIPSWLLEIAPKDEIFEEHEIDDVELKNLEDLFDRSKLDVSETEQPETISEWEKEFSNDESALIDDFLKGLDTTMAGAFSVDQIESEESHKDIMSIPEETQDKDFIQEFADINFSEPVNEVTEVTSIVDADLFKDQEVDKHSLGQIISELETVEKTPSESGDNDWLNSLVVGEEFTDHDKNATSEENKETPDWIKSFANLEDQDTASTEEHDEKLPDWLSEDESVEESQFDNIHIYFDEKDDANIKEAETINEEISSLEEISAESALIPEIINKALSEDEEIDDERTLAEESLKMLEEQMIKNELETEVQINEENEFPDHLYEKEEIDSAGPKDDLESALAWMEELSQKHGAIEDTEMSESLVQGEKLEKLENEIDTTPSWLKDLEIETDKDSTPTTPQPDISVDEEISVLTDAVEDSSLEEPIEPVFEKEHTETEELDGSEEISEPVSAMEPLELPKTEQDRAITEEPQKELEFLVQDTEFDEATHSLFSGNIEKSLEVYNAFIQKGDYLHEIIGNIQNALDHYYPIDINLWQALGDAHVKNNQLQKALDAYSKAEDLLL